MDPILETQTPGDFAYLTLKSFSSRPDIVEHLMRNTALDKSFLETGPLPITMRDQQQLLANLNEKLGPDWILKNASLFDTRGFRAFAAAVTSSATVADALDVVTKYGHTLASAMYLEQFNTPAHRILSFNFVLRSDAERRAFSELAAVALLPLGRDTLKERMRHLELWFAYPEPSYSALYTDVFKCKVKFGQDYNAWAVPVSLLPYPSPFADPAKNALALAELQRMIEPKELQQTPEEDFIEHLDAFLMAYSAGRPSANDAALAMKLSKRSFTRKLNQHGTTFREISDVALQRRAQILMSGTRTSREDVAEKLGYSDVTSFSRALSRWRRKKSAP